MSKNKKHVQKKKRDKQMLNSICKYSVYQCSICHEAWPLSSNRNRNKCYCLRCPTDKGQPQQFSRESKMVPSPVPPELRGLTQIEEMLIARALPLIHVYLKLGGKREY